MKNPNLSTKSETFLSYLLRPFPAFLSGAVAGSLVTVYGTLTQVNLFHYLKSNYRDIVPFYGDLLGFSGKPFQSRSGLEGALSLGLGVNPQTLEIYASSNSVCESAILSGDQVLNNTGDTSQPQSQMSVELFQQQVEDITKTGLGNLEVMGTKGKAKIEINLLKKQPTCIRTPENIQVLEQLLQARKWREADLKTYEIMLAVTKRKAVGHLDSPSIESFPCPELQAIDRLWQQESGGLWGLGVQKEIYQRAGNRPSSEESQTYNLDAYVQFNDLVRWIQTSDNGKESWKPAEQLIFSLDAPEGHLPRLEQLGTGIEQTQPGYKLVSSKSLPLTSQEIQARNLLYARVAACEQ